MTTGKLLAKNTLWNLAGQLLPVLVGLICIPVLITGLGKERFGILTLIWAAIGYLGLFDLGLGRALTQAVGAALGRNDHRALESLPRTALRIMFALGVAAALLVVAITPWLVRAPLNVPASMQHEAATAFYLLALSLPFVLATAGYRGLFEAHQDFRIATAVRLPFAVINFLGPVAALSFSHSLVPTVATLVVGRIAGCAAHAVVCARRYAFIARGRATPHGKLWPLMRIGGWMTVSNIVSPLMYNVDRFFVGGMLSMTAVAYYVTAFELGSKLLLIPAAVLGVLFPALTTAYAGDPAHARGLMERAVRLMTVLMFIPVVLVVAFAHAGLRLWVGPDMARVGAPVLRWIAVGVLANSVAQIPFAAIQAVGRPDITAKLHLLELPIYVGLLVWLTKMLGVQGVAIAWTMRVTIDCIALLGLTAAKIPELRPAVVRPLGFFTCAVALVGAPALAGETVVNVLTTCSVLVVFAWMAWRWGLGAAERDVARQLLRARYDGVRAA